MPGIETEKAALREVVARLRNLSADEVTEAVNRDLEPVREALEERALARTVSPERLREPFTI